uniref:Uncharacterized protein n=1 Tax=Pseudo-nitzschia australis TaxID=44445 RepID=A0A7S4AN10_9STRA|mmetsp:Transcript_27627/g.60826  ORF Transcript_27627/g.60826 Transcript_27627/m.60826 type:complete len:155 (-) Transcript_27627:349-813(-)|eukprot:CAMPEP_0168180874 /NCGR_PEP_ID=MMETSP0139_2-20121125/10830_1 /TAXON_ID=44445 /ORGANISM="Pseudo-nitzschia australis, Strain 10249 10 AB" /LENGTH=154 /DNA_ID=CAMNT_0008101241 /DNA_START=144 /DNA_END=608 /DNA_ORIENTATION=+
MSPPPHVKIISGTASTVLLVIGLRNLFAPGSRIPFLDGEHSLQGFFWGTKKPEELVSGQKAASKLAGVNLLALVAAKFTVLFTHGNEGTFLRRNMFAALGATQLAGSIFLLGGDTQEKAKSSGASFWTMAAILGGEGLVLLHDALLRDRPVKPH